jgi:hypothetical protein
MHLKQQIRLLRTEFREHKTRTIVTFLVLILTWIPLWRLMHSVEGGKHFDDGMHSSALLAIIEAGSLIGGPYAIRASIYNLDWYFTSETARPLVELLGRTGARIFYLALGLGLSLVALIGLVFPLLGYLLLFQDLLHH